MNKSIERIKDEKNIGFLFEDEDCFSQVGFKVTQAPDKDCFLKGVKLRYNGQLRLIYFTEEYQSLSTVLPNMQLNTIAVLLCRLVAKILQVPEYGYISYENLLISPEDVFVDQNTLEPKFIYLPINGESNAESKMTFENKLRRNLHGAIRNDGTPACIDFKNMLLETGGGLEGLLKSLQRYANIKDAGSTPKADVKGLRLVCANPNYNVRFDIPGKSFSIGRSKENEGVLPFSNMISRKHCTIVRKNNTYYVVDEQSKKGTMLNGKLCQAGVEVPLKEGDVIKIWELSFTVKYI